MPFPFSVSTTVTAGGVSPEDVHKFAQWLEGELRRNRATDAAFVNGSIRFRSWLAIGGPLGGIGGGVLDLNETAASGKVHVTLSLIPLALVLAALCALAVWSQRAGGSIAEDVGVWAALFAVAFLPWYLVLPERFGRFLEECISRYYQSPLARSDVAPPQGA